MKHQAKILGQVNRSKHSLEAMKKNFNQILDNIVKQIPETPQAMSLKLPKLKKVGSESKKPAKIKLPKLKKVT